MLQQNDDKHEEAHKRIRATTDRIELAHKELELKVQAMQLAFTQAATEATLERRTPIDVGKIMFNPKMVLGIVGLVVSIVTGNYLTQSSVREEVRAAREDVGGIRAEIAKASAVQAAMQVTIEDLKRQMEMRRLEIQALSNDLQQQLRRNPR